MKKRYKVIVNKAFDFEFNEDELSALDAVETSKSKYHLLQKNKSFNAVITQANYLAREYTVKINSNTYKLDISNELDLLIEKMGLSPGSSQLVNEIKAPMPGLILEVNVEEGSQIKEGDYLLVLEAMKMENTLTAPRDAVVKSIAVKKGQTVEKNQLLLEME